MEFYYIYSQLQQELKMKKLIQEFFRNRELSGVIQENNIPNDILKEIMKGYIECAIWTEEEELKDQMNQGFEQEDDENDEESNNPELDKLIRLQANMNQKHFDSFSEENIDANSLIQAYLDIKKFISNVPFEYIQEAIQENGTGRLGHDIWLTRNRHGAGFFDHTYDSDMEHALTKAASDLKEVYFYVGDDNLLHFSNTN